MDSYIYETRMLNLEKISQQKGYNIDDTTFYFPYLLYDSQQILITSILKAVKNKQNGLFHSPTGTGKTLCFLVSILAYMDNHPNEKMRLIYCTRTHSQINGIIKELKKSCYEPNICMLGSRDILCLNDGLKNLKGELKNLQCSQIRKNCEYFNNFDIKNIIQKITGSEDDKIMPNLEEANQIIDLEELSQLGKQKMFCPYYFSKSKNNLAELLIVTYNYVLNPKIRKMSNILLDDAVIVFDEAHNLEDICEELLSFNFSFDFFTKILSVLKFFHEQMQLSDYSIENFQKLNGIFVEVEQFQEKSKKNFGEKTQLRLYKEDLRNFIQDIFENSQEIIKKGKISEHLHGMLTKPSEEQKDDSIKKEIKKSFKLIQKFSTFLWKINYLKKQFLKNFDSTDHFVMVLQKYFSNKKDFDIKFSLICFDPTVIFQKLLAPTRCVLLTSGTLAPLELYESRIRVPFPVKLINIHPIHPENICASILLTGKLKNSFDFSKKKRENEKGDIFESSALNLGETLLHLFQKIPNGKLIFFASFSYMEKIISFWKNDKESKIYERIAEITQIFIEEKSNDKNNKKKESFSLLEADENEKLETEINEKRFKFYNNFFEAASLEKGAVLFGVLRGKGSEGIDFADHAARAVFIVGIPFLPIYDLKVELKMKYLDEINKKNPGKMISGQLWYELQAVKSVNQGIGRVIRHKNDYGAIVLIDERYCYRKSVIGNISEWARNKIETDKFDILCKKIERFFERKKI